jgi:hypothetical protein
MPPIARPFPRFIADTAQQARPYGDWEERLGAAFAEACAPLTSEGAAAPVDVSTLRLFPERTWGRRTYVPIVGRASDQDGGLPEYYGYVSFEATAGEGDAPGESGELTAEADFTDITADENPDWEIDLNDAVIGEWHGDGGRGGEVTLIWGTPLIRGAIASSAELDGDVLDQAAVNDGRFSLVAVDAVHGFGDDLFLEVKLWDRRLNQLASESLYESDDEAAEDDEVAGPDAETDADEDPKA